MAHTTEDQFNVQWDVLQNSDNPPALLDPLSDIMNSTTINDDILSNGNGNEPAVLSSQSYFSESSHIDIDISDKQHTYDHHSLASSSSGSSNSSNSRNSGSNNNYNGISSTSPQQQKKERLIINTKKIVQVNDPRKEVEQQSTFISYLVVSEKNQVRRRFQDFVWLHNVLYTHFPACFVPPLPDKHRLEYVKGDRFSTEFIEKRRISLERFVQRIARHPILGHADFFIMFLESSGFNDASARALREGQETVMDTIGDSLLNAFSKIRKPDPRFVEMKERNDRMEENLDMLQKTLLRTNKRTEDLVKDYEEFTTSVHGLAAIEPNYKQPLGHFTQGLQKYAANLKLMTVEDTKWQIEVSDYMAYYHAVKDVLKLRDQKQLDFEELSDYLQSTMEERNKTIRNQDGGFTSGVASFITGKLNEVRGADTDKIKREKVLKLDERVRELQDAIDQTHEVSTAFSDQVKKEDAVFNRNKSIEIFDVLKTYTEAKVNFYQDSVNVWRDVVQALENDGNNNPNVL